MRPEDIRKLVGGYATGTLTAEERRLLFQAALDDQALYDELAREQPFKQLLNDPRARRQLIDAVSPKRWLWQPASWALAGALASVVLLVVIFTRNPQLPPETQPVLTAKREADAPPPPPATSIALPEPRAEKRQVSAREAAPRANSVSLPQPPAKELLEMTKSEAPPARLDKPRSMAAPAAGAFRADFAAQRVGIPYRILRAGADGQYAELEPQTVPGAEDRLRVAFDPPESGRLQVAVRGSVLLDTAVQGAVTTNLDLPGGAQTLVVIFTPSSGSMPTIFEILIPR